MNGMVPVGIQGVSKAFTLAVLDSNKDVLTVLNRAGTIVAVNDAWRRFAELNGAPEPVRNGVGINYLEVCRRAGGEFSDETPHVLEGIQAVLEGSRSSYTVEYPCHSPEQKRWFLLKASPLTTKEGGAVVTHTDITSRRLAEEALRDYFLSYLKSDNCYLV